MIITKEPKETWKDDKAVLQTAISSLEKSLTDFKTERKSVWKAFKSKFNDDMTNIEKSLDKLKAQHKK
jgi:hypothetical protein